MTGGGSRTAAAVMVAAVLLGVLAVAVVLAVRTPSASTSSSPATASPSPPTGGDAWSYAQTLPVRTRPAPSPGAYVGGDRETAPFLVIDGQTVDLPARVGGLVAGPYPTAYGPLVSLSSDSFAGGDCDPFQRTGLVTPAGLFQSLHVGCVHGVAVSPDGRQAALGQLADSQPVTAVMVTVRDLATRATVTDVAQPHTSAVQGWGPEGVIVTTGTGTTTQWRPGSAPRSLPFTDIQVAPDAPVAAVVTRDGCLHQYDLGTGRLGVGFACGGAGNGPMVSPRGSRVLVGPTAYDLATGKPTARQLPRPLWFADSTWADDSTLLTEVLDPVTLRGGTVSCDVVRGGCSRDG